MIDLVILEKEILEEVKSVKDQDGLEAIRVGELGKKGRISLLMKDHSSLCLLFQQNGLFLFLLVQFSSIILFSF